MRIQSVRNPLLLMLAIQLNSPMPPCLAYSFQASLEEHAEWADVIVLGELVDIIHGPPTGAEIPHSVIATDESGLPTGGVENVAERVMFLRFEVEETFKVSGVELDVALAAYTTYAIDRRVGDYLFFDQSRIGERYLVFLGNAPISRGRGGFNRFYLLGAAIPIVSGKINVLVDESTWTYEDVPLQSALAKLRIKFGH